MRLSYGVVPAVRRSGLVLTVSLLVRPGAAVPDQVTPPRPAKRRAPPPPQPRRSLQPATRRSGEPRRRPATPPSTASPTTVANAFVGTVSTVTAAEIPGTYRAGCPVGPAQLRMLHMSYWGFDSQPHVGTMVVNQVVTSSVLAVFAELFQERFPIHQMQPEDAFQGHDPASMAADNTSGFNCRFAVAPGPPQWSVHAYGEAIDVNTVENPYVEGGTVQPPAGRLLRIAPTTDPAWPSPVASSPRRWHPSAGTGAGPVGQRP